MLERKSLANASRQQEAAQDRPPPPAGCPAAHQPARPCMPLEYPGAQCRARKFRPWGAGTCSGRLQVVRRLWENDDLVDAVGARLAHEIRHVLAVRQPARHGDVSRTFDECGGSRERPPGRPGDRLMFAVLGEFPRLGLCCAGGARRCTTAVAVAVARCWRPTRLPGRRPVVGRPSPVDAGHAEDGDVLVAVLVHEDGQDEVLRAQPGLPNGLAHRVAAAVAAGPAGQVLHEEREGRGRRRRRAFDACGPLNRRLVGLGWCVCVGARVHS